jgi:hypothetical protein
MQPNAVEFSQHQSKSIINQNLTIQHTAFDFSPTGSTPVGFDGKPSALAPSPRTLEQDLISQRQLLAL